MKIASVKNDGTLLVSQKNVSKKIAPEKMVPENLASGKNVAFRGSTKEGQKASGNLPLYLLGAAAFGGIMLLSSGKLSPQKTPRVSFQGGDEAKLFRRFEVTGKIEDELRLSSIARKLGIKTPEISGDNSYKIFGMKADPNTNPLDRRHFKNVLDNIFKMDKGEIYHGDLEKAHVFYSKNGEVEVDCFRFGYLFSEKPWEIEREFPNIIYPSNATQYENLSLGHYISKIPDDSKKTEVLKDYLKESAAFHKRRADFLAQSNKGAKEQIQYERLQAELFEEPAPEIMELFKKRISVQYGHREMFTNWDEGFGACGHTPNEKRTTDAVIEYFDVVKANMQYLEDLKGAKAAAPAGKMREYLDFEEQYASHWLKNHSNSINGMSEWTLNPENKINQTHTNVSEGQRSALKALFEKFSELTGFEEKTAALQRAKEKYLELLQI